MVLASTHRPLIRTSGSRLEKVEQADKRIKCRVGTVQHWLTVTVIERQFELSKSEKEAEEEEEEEEAEDRVLWTGSHHWPTFARKQKEEEEAASIVAAVTSLSHFLLSIFSISYFCFQAPNQYRQKESSIDISLAPENQSFFFSSPSSTSL
jgi:hypothetical protein